MKNQTNSLKVGLSPLIRLFQSRCDVHLDRQTFIFIPRFDISLMIVILLPIVIIMVIMVIIMIIVSSSSSKSYVS